MPREIVEPVTTVSSGVHDTVTTHPAYAQIGASRVSGYSALYDSDFKHQHYMTITIRRSELHRSLNRDCHYGRGELIEVGLSEAQWATFVSSPNMGSGVPCTLQALNGKLVPGLPEPVSRVDQFAKEIKDSLAETLGLMDRAMAELKELGLSKAKQDRMATLLNAAHMQIKSNLPFVASQFDGHMETTVEKAKQEVHGYMTMAIQRAGLAALEADEGPFRITTD